MGVDYFDTILQIEKSFGIRLQADDFLFAVDGRQNDITVAELHEIVCRKCVEGNLVIPQSSWSLIQQAIHHATGIPIKMIQKQSKLRADLEMY